MRTTTATTQVLDSLHMALDIGIAPLIDAGLSEQVIKGLLHVLVDQLDYSPTTDQ